MTCPYWYQKFCNPKTKPPMKGWGLFLLKWVASRRHFIIPTWDHRQVEVACNNFQVKIISPFTFSLHLRTCPFKKNYMFVFCHWTIGLFRKNSLNLGSIWIHKNVRIAHTNKDIIWNSILGISQTWASPKSCCKSVKIRTSKQKLNLGLNSLRHTLGCFCPSGKWSFLQIFQQKMMLRDIHFWQGVHPKRQLQVLLFSGPWRPTLFVSKGRIGQDNDLKAFCRRDAVGAVLVAFVQSNPCKRVWWWDLLTNHIQDPPFISSR